MNHRNNAKALVLTVLFLVSSWNLQALNVQTFNPSITQGGGFRVLGAETLPAGSAAFGLGLNFVKGSLTVQDITGGGIEREIVPWMFTQNLQAEAGLCRRFTLGLDLPLSLVKQLPVGGGTTTDKAYSVGDLSLYGRLNILSQQNSFLGLAVVPFIEVPTGAVDHFTGDEGVVLGVKAAIEKTIGRFNSAINIGYRGRTSDNTVSQGAGITPLSVGDEITYGLAASVELIKNRLDLVGDLYGSTTVSDFGTDRQSSPLEFIGGFKTYFLDKKVTWNVGAGTGLISGYGSPDYRVLTGLVVRSSLLSQKQISDPFKPISIYFDFDHANLSRDAQMYLDKQAAYLKEHPQSKLSVEGHTDSMGSDAYNQRLSEKRAGNALHYLKKKVSDTSRLKSVGYGETRPIDTNSTKEGRARNRRVDLRLIK